MQAKYSHSVHPHCCLSNSVTLCTLLKIPKSKAPTPKVSLTRLLSLLMFISSDFSLKYHLANIIVLTDGMQCGHKGLEEWNQRRAAYRRSLLFLHIKPHSKDIYDHIQCSTALLWQPAQSWELELIAYNTASWKQQSSMCTQSDEKYIKSLF